MKNTYEKLFDEFLNLTEFSLLKHRTESDDPLRNGRKD